MKKEGAVFLDLDKTVVACSTEKVFGYYLFKKGILGRSKFFNIILNYIKYDLHFIKNYTDVKSRIIYGITKDVQVGFYEEIFNDFFKKNLKNKIYPEIYNIIKTQKAIGNKIYIISAAMSFIVKCFADILEVDGYYATELENKNGIYNGKVYGMIHYGK